MAMAAPLLVGKAAAAGAMASGVPLAATAAGAATTGLFGAGGALTLGGVMKGVGLLSSLMGGLQNMQGAAYQESAAKMEAMQIESQIEAEKTRAMQEQAERQQRLNQILSSQMAAQAGRGIQVGSGSSLAIADFSQQEFEEESDIARTDSEQRIRQLRMQAGQTRLRGKASLLSSRTSGMQSMVQGGLNMFERTKTI